MKIARIITHTIKKITSWFKKILGFSKVEEISKQRIIIENISDNYYEQILATKEDFDDIDTRLLLTYDSDLSYNGWTLPGQQKEHYWCGTWKAKGCTNTKAHQHSGYGNTTYVRQYKKSCFRASCRKCMNRWATRQALVASKRTEIYEKHRGGQLRYAKVSFPSNYDFDDIKKARKEILKILKDKGAKGGAIIFSPFELDQQNWTWYEIPYFFVAYYGKMKSGSIKGWNISNKQTTKSSESVFYASLRMSGVKKGNSSFVWFGELSYSKLKLVKPSKKIETCPACNAKLHELIQMRPNFEPDSWQWGFYDSDDWKLADPEIRKKYAVLSKIQIPKKIRTKIINSDKLHLMT